MRLDATSADALRQHEATDLEARRAHKRQTKQPAAEAAATEQQQLAALCALQRKASSVCRQPTPAAAKELHWQKTTTAAT